MHVRNRSCEWIWRHHLPLMMFALVHVIGLGTVIGDGMSVVGRANHPEEPWTAQAGSFVGGVFRDPYGSQIASAAPVGWWRLDELLPNGVSSRYSPCVSCSNSATTDDTSLSRIHGIPNTEALRHPSHVGEGIPTAPEGSSGFRLIGQGGIAVPYAERLFQHSSFTLELWLRLARANTMREQAVASCGSIMMCASGDPTCQRTTVRAKVGSCC